MTGSQQPTVRIELLDRMIAVTEADVVVVLKGE